VAGEVTGTAVSASFGTALCATPDRDLVQHMIALYRVDGQG